MRFNMDTEFTEEEVVENPTLKAAYNLAPLHQNQPLRWDYEVELIGEKVYDKAIHLCEVCELPILFYGRLLPCKHIFCFLCARKCGSKCRRCSTEVQKLEELALGTVYVCAHGAPKHSTKVCRRTYLSQRDLQSHFAHRHMSKSTIEIKSHHSAQPAQMPLTQQQAAAVLQHPTQTTSLHGQPTGGLSSSGHQGMLATPSHVPSMGGGHSVSSQDSMQLLTSIPGMGDMRTASVSPIVSRASPDLKSNPLLSHPGVFNQPPQSSDAGMYRNLDVSTLQLQQQQMQQQQQQQQHHLQLQQQHLHQHQQQHSMHQHQQSHLLQPSKQQQSHMMRLTGSPGMMRFNQQPPQVSSSSSSSLLPLPGSRVHPYQATSSGSSDMLMSSTRSQMHHHQQSQQNVAVHQQKQLSGAMQQPSHSHSQAQMFMPKTLEKPPTSSDAERTDFYNSRSTRDNFGGSMQNRSDNFANPQNRESLSGMQPRDNFNILQQRKPSYNNNLSEMDGFSARQKVENFNPQQGRDSFNRQNKMDTFNSSQTRDGALLQAGLSDGSKLSPNLQGGLSRNKNVNLITVPIQDEGQYRPLPFVGQTQQLPMGGGGGGVNNNTNNIPFSPNSMPSNFSPLNSSTNPRMPFNNRPGGGGGGNNNPQVGNSSNPALMMNQLMAAGGAGGGVAAGLNLSNSVPPNMQGALAGMVQALAGAQAAAGVGGGQGVMMTNSGGSLNNNSAPHNNLRFNSPHTPGSNWSIQPRMTHNSPRPKGDGAFKQNYFG